MRYRPIIVDSMMQELTRHGTEDFPVSMDEQTVNDEGCKEIRHWHYEVQIGIISKGSVKFETPLGEYVLREGDGIFINSGVVHEAKPEGNSDGVYICVNFRPEIVSGKSETIYRDYVRPLMECEELASFALKKDIPWQKQILDTMKELTEVDTRADYGYEMKEQMLLSRIWSLVTDNNREKIEKGADVSYTYRQRAKVLKEFIARNYDRPLSLQEIANAGNVSRGECCRTFQKAENISPMNYLKKVRLQKSETLLLCTDLSIQEIADRTGFDSCSYFIERFHKEKGITPKEFRVKYTHSDRVRKGE